MKLKIENGKAEDVVKEAMWLAWQACGGTLGMGFLQDNPGATKEDVWKNVASDGDYTVNFRNKKGEVLADYVFGRMMKLSVKYTDDELEVRDESPKPDYQAWCREYPTYEALIEKAAQNVDAVIVV